LNVYLKFLNYKPKPEDASPNAQKGSSQVSSLLKAAPIIQVPLSNDALADKEQTIQELKETIEIMEVKIKKLEQLVKLKDSKIQALTNILTQNGISDNQ